MPPNKLQVIETLRGTGVVAVIRIDDPTDLLDVARALNEGGVKAAKAKQFTTITENARTFRRIVAEARGGRQ